MAQDEHPTTEHPTTEQPHTGLEVEAVTPIIGAEVRGLDLHQPLGPQVQEELRRALMRHLVLFVRDQAVSESEQLAFASVFGPPVAASVNASRDAGEMLFVTLEDTADDPPRSDRWHTDVPFVAEPPDVAVLSMIVSPPVGGDTMWTNLYRAYDALSPTMQELLTGLDLDLDLGASADAIRKMYGEEYYAEVMGHFQGARHPLVRVHPVTGRRALFLCGSFMRGISGMHRAESDVLLGYLRSGLDDPNIQCRWRWRQGDLAVWDERCTNHRGLSDHYPGHRIVRRCLAGSGVPVGAR